jgi:hypothetical protein
MKHLLTCFGSQKNLAESGNKKLKIYIDAPIYADIE